jgi:hypothetical protein
MVVARARHVEQVAHGPLLQTLRTPGPTGEVEQAALELDQRSVMARHGTRQV